MGCKRPLVRIQSSRHKRTNGIIPILSFFYRLPKYRSFNKPYIFYQQFKKVYFGKHTIKYVLAKIDGRKFKKARIRNRASYAGYRCQHCNGKGEYFTPKAQIQGGKINQRDVAGLSD